MTIFFGVIFVPKSGDKRTFLLKYCIYSYKWFYFLRGVCVHMWLHHFFKEIMRSSWQLKNEQCVITLVSGWIPFNYFISTVGSRIVGLFLGSPLSMWNSFCRVMLTVPLTGSGKRRKLNFDSNLITWRGVFILIESEDMSWWNWAFVSTFQFWKPVMLIVGIHADLFLDKLLCGFNGGRWWEASFGLP